MHGRILHALALLLVATAALAAPDPVLIVLRPEAAVSAGTVRLADVAMLRGGDPALARRLGQLDLAELTAKQPQVTLRRGQVALRIQIDGIAAEAYRLDGPAQTNVTLAGDAVPPALPEATLESDVVAAAIAHLRQKLPWPAAQTHVTLAQPIALPADLEAVDLVKPVPSLGGQSALAGRVRVDVALNVRGEARGVVPVFFDVQLEQEVAIAKRRIEVGELLTEDNLHADVRMLNGRAAYPTYRECVTNQRAKRRLTVGQVVSASDAEAVVENATVVKSRDLVRIVGRIGGMRISTAGEALQDGKAGQTIRVRNTSSNRVIQAKVVEHGIVEVDF